VLMSSIIDFEPSSFDEATGQQVWKDAMMKEYQSMMKTNVWDIVLRPEGKFVLTSKWIYKIKYVPYGSIEKYKAREGSPKKWEWTMRRLLFQSPGIPLSRLLFHLLR
jgi:hypothetical protein